MLEPSPFYLGKCVMISSGECSNRLYHFRDPDEIDDVLGVSHNDLKPSLSLWSPCGVDW